MAVNTDGDLGSIVAVWAHPDDEAYLAAGLMASAVAAGRRVVCLTATRGEGGFPADDPRSPAERMAVREAELADCLGLLGVREHRYLGYPDGRCHDADEVEAARTVAAVLAEVRPDTVLCFGPDGGTGHSDHIATCRWTTAAVALLPAPRPRLLYSTKSAEWVRTHFGGVPPEDVMMAEGLIPEQVEVADLAAYFVCAGDLLDLKFAALRAQVSQVEPFAQALGLDNFKAMIAEEFYREPRPEDAARLESNRRLTFRY